RRVVPAAGCRHPALHGDVERLVGPDQRRLPLRRCEHLHELRVLCRVRLHPGAGHPRCVDAVLPQGSLMPSAGDVLITGIGAATTAAVTAGVNAFLMNRNKAKAQRMALAELVIATELLMTDLEPEQQAVIRAKIDAARVTLT